jgi:tetratricopeptide (TPR) repeat protein
LGGFHAEELRATLEEIEREIAALNELDDPLGLAEAYREAAKLESHLGRTEQADRLFERAVENARLGGNRRIESDVLLWRLAMQCWGYLPAGAGLRQSNELLERGVGGLAEAFARIVRGRYRALQGDLACGRADIEAGRALVREIGAGLYIAGSGQEHGECELEAGNYATAEPILREAYELSERMGGGALSTTSAAMLARALVDQGRLDEAERFARISERTVQVDDIFTQFDWREALSRVLARRGDVAAGEALALEAVALAEQTDYLEGHARTVLGLAEVLALAGRAEEGRPFVERAILLYDQKESVVGAERARSRLRELTREPLAERD